MARYNHTRNNFLAGEVSPRFYGRSDVNEYAQGMEICENAYVYPQGGVGKRPGTQFGFSAVSYTNIAAGATITPTLSDATRLIPVEVGGIGYILVLTGYVATHDHGIAVYNTSTGAFLNLLSTGFVKTIALAAASIPNVQAAVVGTQVILTTGAGYPIKISVLSSTLYILTHTIQNPLDYFMCVPFQPYSFTIFSTPTLTLAAGTTYARRITSSVAGTFTADSVGDVIDFGDLTSGGFAVLLIKQYISGTVVEADVASAKGAAIDNTDYGGSTYFYRFASWSSTYGFPKTVASFNGRVVYGGSTTYPNRLWASGVGGLGPEFDLPYGSGSPIVVTERVASSPSAFDIASSGDSGITFLVAGKNLTIGTGGREYVAESLDPVGDNAVNISAESSEGSVLGMAYRVNSGVVFKHRSKQRLLYLQYNFNEDAFKPSDLNVMGDHIFKHSHKYFTSFSAPELKEFGYQSGEEKLLWAIDNNGALFSFTFNPDMGVMAWERHIIGGVFGAEQAKVISLAVAYNAVTAHDDVWLLVKRTINSSTVYYAEKIGQEFYLDDLYNTAVTLQYKPVFCDSSKLVRLGSPGTTFTGLSHLEGQTVQVLADGNYIGEKVITSGNLVLTRNYTEVIVGLKYTMKIKPLLAEPGSVIGSGMGAIRRIDRAVIKFFDTVGAKVGARYGTEQGLEFRPITLDMDEEIPLFSGQQVVEFEGDYEREASIVVTQDLPLPCRINYIATRGLLYD